MILLKWLCDLWPWVPLFGELHLLIFIWWTITVAIGSRKQNDLLMHSKFGLQVYYFLYLCLSSRFVYNFFSVVHSSCNFHFNNQIIKRKDFVEKIKILFKQMKIHIQFNKPHEMWKCNPWGKRYSHLCLHKNQIYYWISMY